MNEQDAAKVARLLTLRYGLPLRARLVREKGGLSVVLYPEGVHENEGFALRITPGWRSLETLYLPGAYSGELLSAMSSATADQKMLLCTVAQSLMDNKAAISMSINGSRVSPVDPITWPARWRQFELSLRSAPIAVDGDLSQSPEAVDLAAHWGGSLLGMIIPLLPLELDEPLSDISSGHPEGALMRVTVNKYERSGANRAACIAIWGTTCQACGLDFGRVYGPVGEGFIEVHHVTPVSRLGDGYNVNPVKDLIPVCSNCHRMLHRRDPPYAIDELKQLIKSRPSQ